MKGNNAEGDGTAAVNPGGTPNRCATVTTAKGEGLSTYNEHVLRRSVCFKGQYLYYIAVDAGFQPVFLFIWQRKFKRNIMEVLLS